ncbi:MAG: mdcG [Massilia sp.]|jgi:phosphoribosyl-dephospho-CoA transferase|nr:mdcG [Massilia sp.]MDB5791433.1 mdcG [Massilia sp.]
MLAQPDLAPRDLARHDLVWLSPAGWEHAAALAHPGVRDAVLRWGQARWPAVATRISPALAPGPPVHLPLGLSLPPRARDGAKARIALVARAGDIARSRAPLPFAQAIGAVPDAWRLHSGMLLDDAGRAGLDLRVYGSVALQALTGQAYLTPASDIDLLLAPRSIGQYRCALALLARHARALPLDGEILFPGGQAVAWKELLRAPDAKARVLAKSMHVVSLVTVDSLLASLSTDTCTT